MLQISALCVRSGDFVVTSLQSRLSYHQILAIHQEALDIMGPARPTSETARTYAALVMELQKKKAGFLK